MKVLTNLTEEDLDIINKASRIEKRTRTNFVLKASLDKAKEIISEVDKNESN